MSKRGEITIPGLSAIAFVSLFGAGVVAQIPAASEFAWLRDAPITMLLICLCGWSLWLAFRQVEKSIQAHSDVANALREVSKLLAERPCVRNPKND